MEERTEIKFMGPDTYKDKLLDISAKRMLFVLYHIMGLRNGDFMPGLDALNAIAEEHGVHQMDMLDMIGYEKWLKQGL